MVKTYGLTHVAVAVADLDRTEAFYHAILGAVTVYRDPAFLQMQTPGSRDVLVFERNAAQAGKAGGVLHFGFRLIRPADIYAELFARCAAAQPPTNPSTPEVTTHEHQ